jgi:O-antigen ligase
MKNNLINIPLQESSLIALCLVIPAYSDLLISKNVFFQAAAYLSYTFIFFNSFSYYKKYLTQNIFIYASLFFSLIFFASLVNYYSGTVESELINFPGILIRYIYLTTILIVIYDYFLKNKMQSLDDLFKKILIFLSPLIIIISLKILESAFLGHPILARPSKIFENGPQALSEIYIAFLLLSFCLKPKYFLFVFIFSFCFICLLYTRSAFVTSIIILIFYLFFKVRIKKTLKYFLTLSILFFLIYSIYNFPWLSRQLANFSGRLDVYLSALESIKNNPFFGIGFGVRPDHFANIYELDRWTIHNQFLRIAAENGIPILIILLSIIFYTLYQALKLKTYHTIIIVLSVLAMNFFSTRHISINLLSILMYGAMIFIYTRTFVKK